MHLNDYQLSEPSQQDQLHLDSCDFCRNKHDNLIKTRGHLVKSIGQPRLSLHWQDILDSHKTSAVSQPSSDKTVPKNTIGLAALAASFLFAIVIYLHQSPQSEIEIKIALLMEQNKQLQEQVAELSKNIDQNDLTKVTSYQQVLSLDNVIQQSYLDKKTPEEKYELWLERQKLLDQIVNNPQTNKGIKI